MNTKAARAAAQRARRARKREAGRAAGDTRTPNAWMTGPAAGPPGWAWRPTKGGGGKAKVPPSVAIMATPLHAQHMVLDGRGVELAKVQGIERALGAAKLHPSAVAIVGIATDGTVHVLARVAHGLAVASEAEVRRAVERWRARQENVAPLGVSAATSPETSQPGRGDGSSPPSPTSTRSPTPRTGARGDSFASASGSRAVWSAEPPDAA